MSRRMTFESACNQIHECIDAGKKPSTASALRVLGELTEGEIAQIATKIVKDELSRLRQIVKRLRKPPDDGPRAYAGVLLHGVGWDVTCSTFWAAAGHHSRTYVARRAIRAIFGDDWRPPSSAPPITVWGRPGGTDENGRHTIVELSWTPAKGLIPITVFLNDKGENR